MILLNVERLKTHANHWVFFPPIPIISPDIRVFFNILASVIEILSIHNKLCNGKKMILLTIPLVHTILITCLQMYRNI